MDGLLGCGLNSAPKGALAHAIRAINTCSARCVSIDIPSGVDASSGVTYDPYIDAVATLSFVAAKTAFLTLPLSNVFIADIGIPLRCLDVDS